MIARNIELKGKIHLNILDSGYQRSGVFYLIKSLIIYVTKLLHPVWSRRVRTRLTTKFKMAAYSAMKNLTIQTSCGTLSIKNSV